MPARSTASPKSTLAVSITSMFVIGTLSGALGPLLPQFSSRVGAPVEDFGAVFTALFLGALGMEISGGWLNERVGLHNMVVAGTALLSVGILGIAVSPGLPAILACAFLAGVGQGTLDISTNVLVAAVFEERRVVSAVNLLHFAFGAGAVLSPLLMSLTITIWGGPMPVLWLAAAIGAANTLVATRWAMDAKPGRRDLLRPGPRNAIYTRPVLWFLGVLLFLGVGVEMGVGGWTTVYALRTTTLAPSAIALLVSGYWLALTAGRLIGAVLGVRVTSHRLAMISILGLCLGSALLVAAPGNAGWTIAGTVVIGACIGPIFPSTIVMGTEIFPAAPSRAVSVIVSLGSVGGMVLPPLQGLLLQRVSPPASVGLLAVACLAMLLLLSGVERGARPGLTPLPAKRA